MGGSSQVVARDLLDKRDDASPQAWILDPHEGLGEREPLGRGEELRHVSGPRRLYNSVRPPRYVGRALEEEWHRDLQDKRDLLQAARADAVSPLLIFLNLLEREAETVAERLLAHSKHYSAHPDPAAYVFVDGVGGLFDHCLFHDSLVLPARSEPSALSPRVGERGGNHAVAPESCFSTS